MVLIEEKILAGCRKNKRKSQELLYRHFAKKLYAIAFSYAGERPLAQDILKESFIIIFRNIGHYTSNDSIEDWMSKIVINTALDHLKKVKRIDFNLEVEENNPGWETQNSSIKTVVFNDPSFPDKIPFKTITII